MEKNFPMLDSDPEKMLLAATQEDFSPMERVNLYKSFLKIEEAKILEKHRNGTGGLIIAHERKDLLDILLRSIFNRVLLPFHKKPLLALIATGGYGRGTLNPNSDIDLLFLVSRATNDVSTEVKEVIQANLYLMWDIGLKIGHSVRSISECIDEANRDQQNKTSLMDTRIIAGDQKLFLKFKKTFQSKCINKNQKEFLKQRQLDQRTRHEKYWRTPFLQEPNVKESCGGLRDYHNILWVSRVKRGIMDLNDLVKEKSLTSIAYEEIEKAHEFLHRVRNELHYENGQATDILTLRLQGVVATAFNYPQKSILRRTEEFMRDYYFHTRNLWQHTTSLMEIYQIEEDDSVATGVRSFLTFRKKENESFDKFTVRDGRIYALYDTIFREDPNRMMRMFQHCQLRNLKLSPPMRKLLKLHRDEVDKSFRYAKVNRETFKAILQRKGDVARTLRYMHRVGFLGRFLPEFGALDCLVQHEFFHRYTADEHTLRCVDQVDALLSNDDPKKAFYRKLLLDVADPYALYIAIILHDTGRAENVREHIDGSAILAAKLCKRLQITGATRALIMFLVDNHLIFWRTATTKNIEDPDVIAEFAGVMKTQENLDALLLFTYADSNGTSPDAWTDWKESLMRQLHSFTARFLKQGKEAYAAAIKSEKDDLLSAVIELMRPDYHSWVKEHFERTPNAAFSYREPAHVVTQVRTIRHFTQREEKSESAYCVKWIDHLEKGYTEIVIVSRDRPNFLEKICCVIASEQINILSADFYTRTDGIVIDIFRVCNTNFEPINDQLQRKRFIDTFEKIFIAEKYQPEQYLKRRTNFLKPRSDTTGIVFPVRCYISDDLHPSCTTIEIQALDRIGLLHDLFQAINSYGLNTVHARINTEKGAAIDTLYVSNRDGSKLGDTILLEKLRVSLDDLIGKEEEV
jgi:[protein-PII] uridylyltransferase